MNFPKTTQHYWIAGTFWIACDTTQLKLVSRREGEERNTDLRNNCIQGLQPAQANSVLVFSPCPGSAYFLVVFIFHAVCVMQAFPTPHPETHVQPTWVTTSREGQLPCCTAAKKQSWDETISHWANLCHETLLHGAMLESHAHTWNWRVDSAGLEGE